MVHYRRTALATALFALAAVVLATLWFQQSQAPDSSAARGSTATPTTDGYPPPQPRPATAFPIAATVLSQEASPELRQVTTARYVTLDSWSPDGRWLAIWVDLSTPEPGVGAPGYSTLRFVEAAGTRTCDHPEIRQPVETDSRPPVVWMDDGQVHFNGLGGRPCEEAFATLPEPVVAPTPGILGGPVSPDGAYRIDTRVQSMPPEDTTEHLVTTLVRLSDDRAMVQVSWERSVWARHQIGQWLPDGSFLIWQTHDRGPLRVLVDGTVSQVAPEVFGVPGMGSNDSDEQLAIAVLGEDPPYHLALWSREHGLMLHHPETGQLESLDQGQARLGDGDLEPFTIENPWWEAPWPAGCMVVVGPSSSFLARPPDPPNGPWHMLPGNTGDSQWSPSSDYLAAGSGIASNAKIELAPFPELSPVREFNLPWLDHRMWSPDGRRLALSTNSGEAGAVYLLDVAAR